MKILLFWLIKIEETISWISNEIEKFESPTPKLMIERDNLDKIAKGNTKIFSHFYKNKINGKATKNQFNNFPIIKEVFTQTIYMNK